MRKRLLERVLEGGAGEPRHLGTDLDRVLPSIMDSLRRILNSGRGDASTDPAYGLPDVRGLVRNLPKSTDDMREAIRTAIERYEPRLKRVRVRNITDDDSHRVRFEVVAELRDEDGESRQLKFDTRLERSGEIEVTD